MDNKALLEELATHTNIFEYHIQRLKKKPDQIHELDKEVMGEKVKEIYKLVFSLDTGGSIRKTENPSEKEAEKIPMVEVKPEPEIPRPSAPEMSSETPVPVTEPGNIPESSNEQPETRSEQPSTSSEQPATSNEQPATVREEPVTANEPAATDAAEEPEPEHVPLTTDPIPKTTADLFSGPTTIADSFQVKDDNSIASKVNPTDIRDLKMAIGINDKFLFINELFKGDPSVYNQAIEKLNTAHGMQEATDAIESYRKEYTWADNSEAYHRLKKIVMSKYNG